MLIRDDTGSTLTEGSEVQRRWREYFEILLNTEKQSEPLDDGPTVLWTRKIHQWGRSEMGNEKDKEGESYGSDRNSNRMFQLLGKEGIKWMTELLNKVLDDEVIPEDWQKSILVPIYRQKGDILECNNYRGIKLMQHGIKIYERVLDKRLREVIQIRWNVIWVYAWKEHGRRNFHYETKAWKVPWRQRKSALSFCGPEKGVWLHTKGTGYWCLRKRGILEKLVSAERSLYNRSRDNCANPRRWIRPLSNLLWSPSRTGPEPVPFHRSDGTISATVRRGLPEELLFADDLAIVASSEDALQATWKKELRLLCWFQND